MPSGTGLGGFSVEFYAARVERTDLDIKLDKGR